MISSAKELTELREQLKKEILEMDNQIYELELYYVEDTKETVPTALSRETSSKDSITMFPPKPAKCRPHKKNKKSKTSNASSPSAPSSAKPAKP